MRKESFSANELEILKNAAREARQDHDRLHVSNRNANRTDIVHAGYRLLQCAFAGLIFVYHVIIDATENNPDLWELTVVVIYPCCFFASLILAVTRIMNFIPNPTPIIPVAISTVGWLVMLTGAVLAMRHAQLELHVDIMTDDELAGSPIFQHDLILCALSLIGSTLYLVHAWLCYDCWMWNRRMAKLRTDTDSTMTSFSSSKSESDSGMSSDNETDPVGLPGTSQAKPQTNRYGKLSRKASRLLKNIKKQPESIRPEEIDVLAQLDEILQSSLRVDQIKVEDEPVRLYCCCVDIGNVIKREYMTNLPVHEFQVVHIM